MVPNRQKSASECRRLKCAKIRLQCRNVATLFFRPSFDLKSVIVWHGCPPDHSRCRGHLRPASQDKVSPRSSSSGSHTNLRYAQHVRWCRSNRQSLQSRQYPHTLAHLWYWVRRVACLPPSRRWEWYVLFNKAEMLRLSSSCASKDTHWPYFSSGWWRLGCAQSKLGTNSSNRDTDANDCDWASSNLSTDARNQPNGELQTTIDLPTPMPSFACTCKLDMRPMMDIAKAFSLLWSARLRVCNTKKKLLFCSLEWVNDSGRLMQNF